MFVRSFVRKQNSSVTTENKNLRKSYSENENGTIWLMTSRTDLDWIDFQRRGGYIDSGRTGIIAEMRVTKSCVQEQWTSANDYPLKSKI